MTNHKHNVVENSGRLIGYARVSTAEQSVQMQIDALRKFGVPEKSIHSESVSALRKNRPKLANAMREAREGDTLVVWKLDRIARSLPDLLRLIEELKEQGVKFRSLTEGIENETPAGQLMMHVIGALAQFERDLLIERSRAGMKSARARGTRLGAEYKIKPEEMPNVWRQIREEGRTQASVAAERGVSVQTIARRLKEYEVQAKRTKRQKQKTT